MIRVSARAGALLQRLRRQAALMAARQAEAARRSRRRTDWHTASSLWPDLFGDRPDGK